MEVEVLADAGAFEARAKEHGGRVAGAGGDDDGLARADDGLDAVLVGHEGADAAPARRRGGVLGEGRLGGRGGGSVRGKEETLDVGALVKLGAVLRGVDEPGGGAALLLVVRTAK